MAAEPDLQSLCLLLERCDASLGIPHELADLLLLILIQVEQLGQLPDLITLRWSLHLLSYGTRDDAQEASAAIKNFITVITFSIRFDVHVWRQ
ncbi:hypothetical protein [Halomonas sp. E19]|uniref:hypothetical protein n=1 Tax=Halomonas sp. E19 TaxID=3397247 RepID=UPI0040346699